MMNHRMDKRKNAISWLERINSFRNGSTYITLHQTVFVLCAAIITIVTSYGIVASISGHIDIVGETLVNIEIPSPSVFPIYGKPISFLMAAALGMTYSGFELARPSIRYFSKTQLSFLKMVAFMVIAVSAYEILYNFSIWTAALSVEDLQGILNPDVLINQYPNPNTPWNLVFATKLSVTVFAIAMYTFYFLRQVEKERNEETRSSKENYNP